MMFGKMVGKCDNCGRVIYENELRYWAKFECDCLCFCEYCVKVVDPDGGKKHD